MIAPDDLDARLAALLAAWRDDIDSVPYPDITRATLAARREAA